MDYPQPGGVFYTTDGGETWKNISPLIERGDELIDISIIDELHIWGASDDGKIYATIDGGETWITQFNDTTKTRFMNYIEMFDVNNGVAMGDAPHWMGTVSDSNKALFLRTNDGGENWNIMENNKQIYASGDTWRRLDFVSMDIGYFNENYSGHENQGIMKTHDGGNNWDLLLPEIGIQVMKFYNEDIGLVKWARNDNGNFSSIITRTLDGGETWEDFEIAAPGWGNDFEFLPNDPSKVWFSAGSFPLFYSNDTGRTWVEQEIFDGDLLGRDIVFTDEKHAWFLCDNGKLFYTNNNGGIATDVRENIDEIIPNEFTLEQNYPNPFNPSTVIKYAIPQQTTQRVASTHVVLKVYDVLGKEVATLVNGEQSGGSYEVEFDASGLSSGTYFYRLVAGNFSKTMKFILLK